MQKLTKQDMKKLLKPRDPASYKGQNGRVVIIGGSALYYGAPILAASAALRASADLVYLILPSHISRIAATYSPNFIIRDGGTAYITQEAIAAFESLKEHTDALVVGNGISKHKESLDVVAEILKRWDGPVVIDGDPLGFAKKKGAVYTPHAGEFKRMTAFAPSTEPPERARQVEAAAIDHNGVILLKGHGDFISDGKDVFVNTTGNAGMTVGGTGDTLAGVIGCLLAQRYSSIEAACLGAFLNGLAGDIAFSKLGNSLLATDLVECLPEALLSLQKP